MREDLAVVRRRLRFKSRTGWPALRGQFREADHGCPRLEVDRAKCGVPRYGKTPTSGWILI